MTNGKMRARYRFSTPRCNSELLTFGPVRSGKPITPHNNDAVCREVGYSFAVTEHKDCCYRKMWCNNTSTKRSEGRLSYRLIDYKKHTKLKKSVKFIFSITHFPQENLWGTTDRNSQILAISIPCKLSLSIS